MRFLFDENLSHRLVHLLADVVPGSQHPRGVDLLGATDDNIWRYAASTGLVIVSKDDDFRQRLCGWLSVTLALVRLPSIFAKIYLPFPASFKIQKLPS